MYTGGMPIPAFEMKPFNVVKYCLVLAALFTCGCTGSTTSDSSASKNAFASRIQGSWLSTCQDISANGDANIRGQRLIYSITDTSVTLTYRYYSEATCTSLASVFYFDYSMSISGSIVNGQKIDLSLVDYGATPMNAAVTADYNTRAVCGLNSGWFAFNSRVVTSLGCDPAIGVHFPGTPANTVYFDLLSYDSSVDPARLFSGDTTTGDRSSSSNRPTSLGTVSFIQQ